jgi:integrase
MTDNLYTAKAPKTKALDSLLTREEFMRLMQSAKDQRDRAILCLGILGLRAGEISAFKASWVDVSTRTIAIPPREAKRGKGRTVPFGRVRIVSDVLLSFACLEPEGVNLTREMCWHRVKGMAKRAGITHPMTTHGLRATGATWAAQAGYSITGLQHHFGWSEIKTAQHYVAASGASAMRDMEDCGEKIL